MKKLLFFFCSSFCIFNFAFAQAPPWLWGKDAGGPGNDVGNAISTDYSGNSYTTGRFRATAVFGSLAQTSYGGPDVYVSKYDTYGNCLWVKHGGSTDAVDPYGDEGKGIDIDAQGNCYVTGNFQTQAVFGSFTLSCPTPKREIFVVKYDSSGNEIWARQPTGGTSSNYSRAITVDMAGSSYITGYLGGGTNTFGAFSITHPGAYVVKYDAAGNVQFATSLSTNGSVDAYGISVDAWGNTYITGNILGTDIINGQTFTSTSDADAILIKLDPVGNFLWLQQTQSVPGAVATGWGVAVDVQGNPIITGAFENILSAGPYVLDVAGPDSVTTECFVIKYDSAGTPLWAKQSVSNLASSLGTVSYAITTDSSSNACITGLYRAEVNFDTCGLPDLGMETFVALYDSSGNCQWAAGSTGGNSGAFGYGVSTDHRGNFFITGFYKAPPSFGSYQLSSHLGEDIFVAKLGATVMANFTAPYLLCPGACTDFTNLSINATAYQWSFPGAVVSASTDTNPTGICYNTPGQYEVTLIASNSNGSDTLTLSNYITVYPFPPTLNIVQSGDTLFATTGLASYQWYYNTVLISGATNSFYVASASGDYDVSCLDGNGCSVEAGIFNVIAAVQSTVDSRQLTISPNPVADKLIIQKLKVINGTAEIKIFNVFGEKVYSVRQLADGELAVDCRLFPPGIYFIELTSGEKAFREKFVKD